MVSQLVLVTPTLSELRFVRTGVDGTSATEVQTLVFGMGPSSAIALTRRLEATVHRLSSLALIGWAGSLSPDLAPGDVVLADQALDERGESVPCTVIHLPGARIGALLTVAAPILTPRAKHAARTGVGLAASPVAVEMEGYPLAAWALQHKVPFVHARVILDAADETLPDIVDALDPLGQARPGRLVRLLLERPGLAVPLLRLLIRTRRLGPVLSQVTSAVVQTAID